MTELASDLEAIVAEIDRYVRLAGDPGKDWDFHVLGRYTFEHWPTIRAALERQAELEGALREYGEELAMFEQGVGRSARLRGMWQRIEALLARSAEELPAPLQRPSREAELAEALREFLAGAEFVEQSWFDEEGVEGTEIRVYGHGWEDRFKALLARSAAEEERERG